MKTIEKKLKEIMINKFDPYLFVYNVKNWPNYRDDDPLGVENFEIIEINDDKIILACGSSWQEPQWIHIILNKDDDFEVDKTFMCLDFPYKGIKINEIFE